MAGEGIKSAPQKKKTCKLIQNVDNVNTSLSSHTNYSLFRLRLTITPSLFSLLVLNLLWFGTVYATIDWMGYSVCTLQTKINPIIYSQLQASFKSHKYLKHNAMYLAATQETLTL